MTETMNAFRLHLPVLAHRRTADASPEAPKPIIYGTAFPIAPAIFATAGHVLQAAAGDGEPSLSMMTGPGAAVRIYSAEQYEIFPEWDFGLLRCPSLETLAPMPLELEKRLDLLMPVSAIGFPVALVRRRVCAMYAQRVRRHRCH